jgi:hypothetical protein
MLSDKEGSTCCRKMTERLHVNFGSVPNDIGGWLAR